jgi:cytochrome bd-type quinol oxidase subunit 2
MTAVMRRPSAFLPVAMSLAALGLIVAHVVTAGVAPQRDEGLAAHLWQLLMVAQLPVILYFAVTWLPRAARPAWLVLAIQLLALMAAIAPVAILHW